MDTTNRIHVKPLGAGSEVGRSCLHVKYNEKELLLDCGVHPAYTGMASLPFFDLVDLEKIDAVLITHFHLDHAAALPFLTERTNFKGKVYMTHPTRAILKWLLIDFLRVINNSTDEDFYSEEEFYNCYNKIIPIDYHQEVEINGIRFTALNAGHVLGAAMFLLEIEKTKFLYTGDFSREDDRHLKKAESPNCKIDILITESTYGTQCHLPRVEREARFIKVVSDVVERGGKCLLPVFALGRAQELLLILEEHWDLYKELQKVPIYYSSVLAKRCMTVYQTYMNMMNERIQKISLTKNPFDFKHVENLRDNQKLFDKNACVIMTSPGMLQCGLSRELLEKWCANPRNGVVLTGYSVEGTMAKEILKEPKEITSVKGNLLKLNMTVEYISFSAHVDFTQNSQFIKECDPEHLLFVHGEVNEMLRLKSTIGDQNDKREKEMELYAPKNGEEVSLPIKRYNHAKIFTNKEEFQGLIVANDREVRVYDVEDIERKNIETDFEIIKLIQKHRITYSATWNLIKDVLVRHYGAMIYDKEVTIEECESSSNDSLINTVDKNCEGYEVLFVHNLFIINQGKEIELQWEGNYCNDVLAMAIEKTISEFDTGIRTLRWNLSSELENLKEKMKGYFESVKLEANKIIIDDGFAIIENDLVLCEDGEFKERVERIYKKFKILKSHSHGCNGHSV